MPDRLELLSQAGVAVWSDFIARDWLRKGELRRFVDELSVVGVTSNPTIFAAAMGEGDAYDDELNELARKGLQTPAIFERLAIDDIRSAADDLAGVYERTRKHDGYVSFELPPNIARDSDRSTSEAARLFAAISRPNVFIKIPATAQGIPAIRASIAAGINVNVTLIFSIERYGRVMDAYLGGVEALVAAGGDPSGVASVASFFVSRVDTLVDPQLQRLADAGGPGAERARGRLGTAAIDNAKLAYAEFERTFAGPRWEKLERAGAQKQRPLWASTSTKNKAYRDVLYVEELIAPHTVNTMPVETIEAFADHGEVRGATATQGMERALALWGELAELGIDEEQVGRELEDEGVEKFAASYTSVLDGIERKRALAAG